QAVSGKDLRLTTVNACPPARVIDLAEEQVPVVRREHLHVDLPRAGAVIEQQKFRVEFRIALGQPDQPKPVQVRSGLISQFQYEFALGRTDLELTQGGSTRIAAAGAERPWQ